MPLVNVMINQRAYSIACDEGEEDHLRELGAHVDSKVRELVESVGPAGEQRLLLMAALLIADEYFESVKLAEKRALQIDEISGARDQIGAQVAGHERKAAAALDEAARRVEDIAVRLTQA